MSTLRLKVPDLLDRIITWPVLLYRFLKYGYTFRRIHLGDGIYTIVDPADYYRLCNYNWYLAGNGGKFYAVRNAKIGPGKTKIIGMHRQIMNFPKGLFVDHINRNPLDNRRSNLRLATRSQNMRNTAKRKNTSSRFVGVCFDRSRGKWLARIVVNRKGKNLGRFESEVDAAKAYDAAARKHHGEFARLNFP